MSLILLEPAGPVQACNGVALFFNFISNGGCTCNSKEQTTMRKIGPHLMIPLNNNDMTMVLDVTY
jgi:hypothetical protein